MYMDLGRVTITNNHHLFGYFLAPNILLPTRTSVLPIRMASSKSLDIPIESSRDCGATSSASAIFRRHSMSVRKSGLAPASCSLATLCANAPIVMTPSICKTNPACDIIC